MNGKSYKWLMKSLGSLSLASAVVLLPLILAGCGGDNSSSTVPLPPPPPPPAPPAPPAPPPAPTPTPTPAGSVVSITPANGATNVSIDTSIVIRFSEPVREGPFNQALSITSVNPQQGAVPARTVTFNSDRTQVTITFATPLTNDAIYRVTISSTVPDLFASGRRLAEDFVATFTTGTTAASDGPISFLATQLAAVSRNGQVFSNPVVIPVGFGIRRANPAENIPVGVYTDYRAILSFPIPSSIPSNAVVSRAQLTLVQLPSNDSVTIAGVDVGRGFFFLDPTPHNVPANNVVFQEVTLGAPNNVISSDFFAPASTPSFVALTTSGNVLGGDVSAGPRTADVAPGVQRSVSGSRFYQVRLQCAREVWNNQATAVFPSVSVSISVTGTGSGTAFPVFDPFSNSAPFLLQITGSISNHEPRGSTFSTYEVAAANVGTLTITAFGTVTKIVTFSVPGVGTVSAVLPSGVPFSFTRTATGVLNPAGATSIAGPTVNIPANASATIITTLQLGITYSSNITFSSTEAFSYSATVSASVSTSAAGTPATASGLEISQGGNGTCRAEFDKDTGTGTAPLTTARGPRLDVTFTIPR